ncbi:ABC transporter ATP-binding protein [Virgibacillus sp. W0430]|uniref:ABC transporter ATP-binding protein n=1 Tax=Virgibacillus sp. W0430 TaxID=3391580 RepID=UPI003F47CBE5
MKKTMIKLNNITKHFHTRGQTIRAVEKVNMEVYKGDFVAVVGPSGCGKSTIIRMINDIIQPTAGDIFIKQQKMQGNKTVKQLIKNMGFIFQQPNLFPWLTVRQNVALPLKVFGYSGQKWEDNIDQLLKVFDLEKHADSYPIEISGGMVQKVGVIRAMVHDPEILLMDEPFGALDEITREQLNIELLDVWKKTGKTIIFITHDIKEAVLLASKVYVMGTNPGRIISEVDIDLPRPRSLDIFTDEKFIHYETKLTELIGDVELSKIK